ncbi:hypothetical protein ACH5RR_033989 [Cinchona calisaya]|uniref:Uncharacterized protein n=1 Tax=Cinchona calisaya TaxID=153742 RepID=A0ABD2Y9K0_9GENT
MPDGDQPYYETKQDESNLLVVAKILLPDKEEEVEISASIGVDEINGSVQIVRGPNMADKVVLTRPNTEMVYHLKPLFVQGHLNRVPGARMKEDNGAAMNILPASMMNRLGKCIEDLILTNIMVSSFTGEATDIYGILPVEVTVKFQVVKMDLKPFMARVNATEAAYYHSNLGLHRIIKNKIEKKYCQDAEKMPWPSSTQRKQARRCKEEEKRGLAVYYTDTIFEMKEELTNYDAIDRLATHPVDLEKYVVQAIDDVVKINLGDGQKVGRYIFLPI